MSGMAMMRAERSGLVELDLCPGCGKVRVLGGYCDNCSAMDRVLMAQFDQRQRESFGYPVPMAAQAKKPWNAPQVTAVRVVVEIYEEPARRRGLVDVGFDWLDQVERRLLIAWLVVAAWAVVALCAVGLFWAVRAVIWFGFWVYSL